MVKRKFKKVKRKLFGEVFNFWDLILILTIVPYFYMVFNGISYETGFGGLYYKIFAPALTFATVVKQIVNFVTRKQRK